jgi:hypothetical protein
MLPKFARALAYSPFSTTITAIIAIKLPYIHHPPMASYRNDALVQDKERAVKQSAEARADEVVTLRSEVQWPRSMMSANLTNPLTVATPSLAPTVTTDGQALQVR